MKFLLDHDVPDEVAQVLKHVGHEVALVREALSATAQDPEIFGCAQTHRRIIITCNRGHFMALARAAFEAKPPQPSAAGVASLLSRFHNSGSRLAACRKRRTSIKRLEPLMRSTPYPGRTNPTT